ncbi:protein tyrosine serine phosphatase [Liquorilactobacillus aquaticus DSM 21051]|uniref:Protein tyrosine serine phosphatase n=1 Tax=Liquorilactobacillus aquaticus DSM 21051 TaxID=1423725 RepID=A0A0R2DA63_9LACO|nr:tyrosine-protein phosphatase [Liquorilactobacillus aquaticus]KRM97260.1 protein tyrosine serine phosphatase [Liquorilactobacillus aquaticus DSM 21051]
MVHRKEIIHTDITNFRDIGGYQTSDGHLKAGVFFRSGELYNLKPQNINFLSNTVRLKKIYDFRRPEEISNRPDTSIENILYENINLMSSPGQANPSLKNMVIASNIEEHMLSVYSELVLSPSSQKGYHQFLIEILNNADPIVFHCFAGKDRTGFAAALLLKIAGVSETDIFEDYLLTNEARKKENAEILARFQKTLSPEKLAALDVSLNVKAAYLAHAFDLVKQRYGAFNNYLEKGLQLPANYISKFHEMYIR